MTKGLPQFLRACTHPTCCPGILSATRRRSSSTWITVVRRDRIGFLFSSTVPDRARYLTVMESALYLPTSFNFYAATLPWVARDTTRSSCRAFFLRFAVPMPYFTSCIELAEYPWKRSSTCSIARTRGTTIATFNNLSKDVPTNITRSWTLNLCGTNLRVPCTIGIRWF